MRRSDLTAWSGRHPDLSAAIALAAIALALMSPYVAREDTIPWPRSGLGTDFHFVMNLAQSFLDARRVVDIASARPDGTFPPMIV